MDPIRGSCKLDLSTSGYGVIKLDFLTFLAFQVRALPNCQKNGQFSILSFSNDIVGTINLINAIIINYQLSIEKSALDFFFHSAPTYAPFASLSSC